MRYRWVCSALLLASAAASAEDVAPARKPYLMVRHEEIRPGSMAAHDRHAAAFQAVQRRAASAINWIGFAPVAANDNSVLYLEPWDSLDALEQAGKKADEAIAADASLRAALDDIEKHGDLHSSQKTMLMRYRADLAFQPRSYQEVARSRYLQVMWVRTKPGRGPDYVQHVKELNAARAKAGTDIHFTAYSTLFGGRTGTFLFLSVFPSLKAYEEWLAQGEARTAAVDAALGGPDAARQRRAQYSDLVEEQSIYLYAMAPKLSRPSAEWVAYDPDFWKAAPDPTAAKVPASKKNR